MLAGRRGRAVLCLYFTHEIDVEFAAVASVVCDEIL
jgi:hypothetical protein